MGNVAARVNTNLLIRLHHVVTYLQATKRKKGKLAFLSLIFPNISPAYMQQRLTDITKNFR